MDFNLIVQSIATVGFPIVACIILFYKFSATMDTITETNKNLVDVVSTSIKGMDNKVDKIEEKVEKLVDRIK